ncbi:MAG: ATP-binding protein [Anaerovoracaceae bacterium]
MLRKIIKIDESKCNGCGACASACHEGAIAMVGGVAKLMREDYCDGLGDCLPACPTGAITFEMREAPAYDEAAVKKAQLEKKLMQELGGGMPCGCPGSQTKAIKHETAESKSQSAPASSAAPAQTIASRLSTWPVQIKLAPVNAPYFSGADLLIAADCTAYAYGNFHNDFIKNRVVLIGCPKLDDGDYSEKLTAIIANNDIKSVTVVRMEVPCCGGIEAAARNALQQSGKFIPWQVVTVSTDGKILA